MAAGIQPLFGIRGSSDESSEAEKTEWCDDSIRVKNRSKTSLEGYFREAPYSRRVTHSSSFACGIG